jgi:hypothetical protein
MFLRLSILIIFISFPIRTLANSSLKFWDISERINYVINFKNKTYVKESVQGKIVFTSPLQLVNIDTTALYENFQVVTFKKNELFIITLQGTGQVYSFDPTKKIIKRLDKTHFAGYNFLSIRFTRKDSIYSFGGTGFWQTNNILSFYNYPNGEWDALIHPEIEPIRIKNQISGYFPYYDKVYALEIPKLYSKDENYKPYYWSFDLKSKKWTKLGVINDELKNVQDEMFISDRYCFFKHYTKILWGDPGQNKLFIYQGNKSNFFSLPINIFKKGDFIYFLNKKWNEDKFELDSMKTQELIDNSKIYGSFYQPDHSKEIGFYVIGILFGILSIILIYRKSKQPIEDNTNFESIFNLLLNLPEINTLELNKILNCENKPADTQRQIRARFITQLNQQFLLKYNIENAITRIQSTEDKRFVNYQISKEAISKFKNSKNV